ncbi:MAG TPA: hypothetical protein VIU12_29980 [Chryseolinea sp.]
MKRSQVVDILNGVEDKFDVSSWRVLGVDVWPLLKIQTFLFWFEKNEQEKRQAPAQKPDRKGRMTNVFRLFKSAYWWVIFFMTRQRKRSHLFSGADGHRVVFQGKSVNRYFDPLMDLLEDEHGEHPLLLEQSTFNAACYRADRMIDLNYFYPLANIIVKTRHKQSVVNALKNMPELNAAIEHLEAAFPTLGQGYIKRQMTYMIQTIVVWGFIFDRIFARTKPAYVFGLCYYSLKMYGMNLSAHRQGITSVDMQHGTQGSLHVAYGSFKKVPKDGYTIMPKIFWCWDASSVSAIETWSTKQNFHKVMLGGNPWIQYLDSDKVANPLRDYHKRIILYTLQPLEPLLEDYIIAAIKNTPDEFEWWLRLHPRQLQDKGRLLGILEHHAISGKVKVDEALEYPLPQILRAGSVHLSKFSGAIIEAALMNTPNIILDEIGVAAFQAEMEEGKAVAFLTGDGQALVKLILALQKPLENSEAHERFGDFFIRNFNA